MQSIRRQISLLARKSDSAKDRRRVLLRFAEWQALQSQLPAPRPIGKTLLLIRLDDIGDYLLFRNQLAMYKCSPRWKDHKITLLGNDSWKPLFTLLDQDAVDEAIWVKKNPYLENAPYRFEIWEMLRAGGFESVITLSHTRPLLLDDLCTLAAAADYNIGAANTNVHPEWNGVSDSLFTSLFTPSHPLVHEFQFNAEFAEWACGMRYSGRRPSIEHRFSPPVAYPYAICFVGASTRSRRWPVKRWIEFIAHHRQCFSSKLVFAGNSKAELEMVRIIQRKTGVESIAGTVSLPELLQWVAGAQAVITNDTMAAHMGVSLNQPTVILANGINYMRFSEYKNAGIDNVVTIYPEVFNRRRRHVGDGPYAYSQTVTSDIASIKAALAVKALEDMLRPQAAEMG